MVSKDKPKDWIRGCTTALIHASKLFSSPDTDKAFGLFDSSLYCDKMEEDGKHGEDYKSDMSWMKNKDLIFKDCSSSLELIPPVILLHCVSFPFFNGLQGNYYLSEKKVRIRCPIGPLQDPVTWYGINYAGTQMTQWDFQNKGKSGWTGTSTFVLEVPLRHLRPRVIYSVPCDRILQRAYC